MGQVRIGFDRFGVTRGSDQGRLQAGLISRWKFSPQQTRRGFMFEYDQDIVKSLLTQNGEFKSLYQNHDELKIKVRDAELRVHPVDDVTLGEMKKAKLLAKDQLAAIIEQYRKENVSAHH